MGAGRIIRGVASKLSNAEKKTSDFILDKSIKGSQRAFKGSFRKTDEKLTNLYTGYDLRKRTNIIGMAGLGAYGMGDYTIKTNTIDKSQSNMEYVGNAPINSYDMLGSTKAPTLGASGDLTLALSKQRRG